MHHIEHMIEVRAHDVHLIDVNHAGDVIMVSLSPNSLGLRLNTALCTKNRHASVQNSQGALNLSGEVDVTRGVDDVDAGSVPEAGGCSRGDGYATLLLLLHPVHGRGTLMGLAELVVDTGVEQNTFRSRGLAGVDMSHDTDISRFLK